MLSLHLCSPRCRVGLGSGAGGRPTPWPWPWGVDGQRCLLVLASPVPPLVLLAGDGGTRSPPVVGNTIPRHQPCCPSKGRGVSHLSLVPGAVPPHHQFALGWRQPRLGLGGGRSEKSSLCHKTILGPFMDNGVPGMEAGKLQGWSRVPAHPCSVHHPLSPQQPHRDFLANPPRVKRNVWQNPDSPRLDPTSPGEEFSVCWPLFSLNKRQKLWSL